MSQKISLSRIVAGGLGIVFVLLSGCEAPPLTPDAEPGAAGAPAVGVAEEALTASSCNDRYYACRALCSQQYNTCMKTQCTPIYCATQRDACVDGCLRALHRCDGG